MDAPHLPPKSCNVKWHERILAVPGLLLTVFFGLLSGAAAALAIIAWIVPPFYAPQGITFVDSSRSVPDASLDAAALGALHQRVITIVDTTKKVGGVVYPETAFVGYGAVLSSDGWTVIVGDLYRPGREKQWEGVDAQGVRRAVERVRTDSVSGLVYVKFAGGGFRVFSFPDWQDIDSGASLWQLDPTRAGGRKNDWRPAILGDSARVSTDLAFPAVRPEYRYAIIPEASAGALIATSQGELAGFSDTKGRFIPAWFVASKLSDVLSGRPISYDSLALEGYFAEGVAAGEGVKFLSGFYVTKSRVGSSLKKGDLILRIGGEAVSHEHMTRQLVFAPKEAVFAILRGGEELDIAVNMSAEGSS